MKTLEILCGMPCSGKSTYCKTIPRHLNNYGVSLSKDSIRERSYLFKQPYTYSKENEEKVTKEFDKQIDFWINECDNFHVIALDNTHCKESYIDNIIKKYPKHTIKIKFFEISLLKGHYRNIIRYFNTGKWIPIKVMNTMYRNYNKINKKKYEKYNI